MQQEYALLWPSFSWRPVQVGVVVAIAEGLRDGTSTPKHNLPRHEYPFDSNGKYREEWAREGERRKGWGSGRKYADVDFSRGGTSDDKPTKVASTKPTRRASEKKTQKEKRGGSLLAGRKRRNHESKETSTVRTERATKPRTVPKRASSRFEYEISKRKQLEIAAEFPCGREQLPALQAEGRSFAMSRAWRCGRRRRWLLLLPGPFLWLQLLSPSPSPNPWRRNRHRSRRRLRHPSRSLPPPLSVTTRS